MIKSPSIAFSALPSRLTLASATCSPLPLSLNPTAKMSTDATATAASAAASPPPQHSVRGQQPMLASQRAKLQQDPDMAQSEANSRSRNANSRYFPLGYKDAVHQWWTSVSPTLAERNVLNLIPHLREATADTPLRDGAVSKADPFGPRIWRSTMVKLSGKDRGLNEFSVERVGEQADDTLVMLHGYGAGLGFFYRNFEALSRAPGWKIYALDMLGMGNSTRPPFKIHAKDQQGKIIEAENWFIDSLEEWRKTRKIEKFTLLGHSLGGYLAVSYALKYPGRLNKLILASPAGIPEDPYAVNAAMPEPEESTFQNEFTQEQEGIVNPNETAETTTKVGMNNKQAAATGGTNKTGAPRRPIPGWLVWLWDANVSPFSFVRLAGPLGPRVVSGWTSRRFNHLPPNESQTLHEYAYSLFRQRGSGEYALPYILAPGAYARSPVINRIQDVGRGILKPATETEPAVRETGIPIVLMYGDKDWMDVGAGYAAEEKIKARVVKALLHGTEEEKRRENGSAKVIVVKKAGHHLYLDNPDDFNEAVLEEMKDTREWGLRRRKMEE